MSMLKFLYCCNPSPKSRQYYFVFKFVKKLIILDRQPCSSLEWCSSLEPRSSSLEPTGTMTRPQPDSLAQLVSLPHAPYHVPLVSEPPSLPASDFDAAMETKTMVTATRMEIETFIRYPTPVLAFL